MLFMVLLCGSSVFLVQICTAFGILPYTLILSIFQLHPDHGADGNSTGAFVELKEAYDVLRRPADRRAYDELREMEKNQEMHRNPYHHYTMHRNQQQHRARWVPINSLLALRKINGSCCLHGTAVVSSVSPKAAERDTVVRTFPPFSLFILTI